jgi:hypothetical protein
VKEICGSGAPRSLDFLPAFTSITGMFAATNGFVVSAAGTDFATRLYFVDAGDNSYRMLGSVAGLDLYAASLDGQGALVVSALRFTDGANVTGTLDVAHDTFELREATTDHRVVQVETVW